MLASDLLWKVMAMSATELGLPVLLQADSEGNSYDFASDAVICYATKDLQQTFNDLTEAEEYGLYEDDLTQVLVIYP